MSHPVWLNEKQLVDTLEQTLRQATALHDDQQQRFFREFNPGVGRVDLLQICWNKQRFLQRRQQQTHLFPLRLTRSAAYILAQLSPFDQVDYSELQTRLRLPRTDWNRAIEVLLSRNLIEYTLTSLRIRDITTAYMIDTINAYEAKLFRWKEVIQQAILHEWFTSHSYVVLPTLSQRVMPLLVEACHTSGIGAVLYQDKNDRTIAVTPAQRPVPLTHIGWLLNEQVFDEECRNESAPRASHRGDSRDVSSAYH